MEDSGDGVIHQTTEQLIARCIAPVKKDFLRPPPVRNDDVSVPNDNKPTVLAKEKKSKRQLKRERKQDQNSTKNLCPEVSKSGDVNSCRYKDKCRFSHDIQAFKAQKLDDLEGECPFKSEGCCPYGLSCRFSSTHEEGMPVSSSNGLKERSEVNGFSKDVQKLLWKNNMTYPKADANLRSLGLTIKSRRNDFERLTQKDGDKCVKSDDNGLCGVKSEVKSELENKDDGDNGVCVVKSEVKSELENKDDGDNGVCVVKSELENKDDGDNGVCVVKSEVKSELESNDDGDQSHQSDDEDSCGVTADSGPKLECSAEVIKNNGIKRELESDIPCPQKRIKTEENCEGEETENEGVIVNDQNLDGSCIKSEPKAETEDITPETDLSLNSHRREKKLIDFREKLYLAPLTTVGNLPFRRVCKVLGADVTCGEMAMCTNLLQGQASEWALLRRHSSEDLFGIQICGAYPDTVARTVELIEKECTVDFIDINMGCPIDIVVNKGAGSALLTKPMRMKSVVEVASGTVDIPITMKVRTAYFEGKNRIDSLIADFSSWGASAVTIHGRSRQQRYSKLADWDYVYQCTKKAPKYLQVVGNGDVFSFVDWNNHKTECPELSTCMIARGALIKPWIFTEIKEQRHWDISSGERLNIFKDFVHFGLQHWGSDTKGVETTRRFLLEWLSYTCRYIPVGLLDVVPQRLNWRPPSYYGRDELETLMASDSAADWVRLSEMLLGKVPDGFTFAPKHKSNAYDRAENG